MEHKADLGLLKNRWNNNIIHSKITKSQLSFMMKRNTFSIIDKVLFISIIEFAISAFAQLFLNKSDYLNSFLKVENNPILVFLDYMYYVIFFIFLAQFLFNFKKIDVSSSINDLSKNILRARKSIYNYIFTNIILFNVNVLFFTFTYLNSNESYKKLMNSNNFDNRLEIFNICFYGLLIVFLILISFAIWYIYRLLYFSLLKNLLKNYKELNK